MFWVEQINFLKSCKKIFCYTDEIKNFPEKFKQKIDYNNNPLVRKIFMKLKIIILIKINLIF